MLAEGLSEASIAKRLSVSVTTVRRETGTIREKLGLYHHHSAAGAAAVRRGWIR